MQSGANKITTVIAFICVFLCAMLYIKVSKDNVAYEDYARNSKADVAIQVGGGSSPARGRKKAKSK